MVKLLSDVKNKILKNEQGRIDHYTDQEIKEMQDLKILPTTLEQFIENMQCNEYDAPYFNLKVLNKYPLRDGIIKFRFNEEYNTNYLYSPEYKQTICELPENIVIAGSASLKMLLNILGLKNDKWNNTDTDMFMIGCERHFRLKFNDQLDMIGTKDKTVEQLLLNFDLPICRVGYALNRTIYVSVQCLKAILTRECWIPKYLKDDTKLKDIFRKIYLSWFDEKSVVTIKELDDEVNKFLNIICTRMKKRLKKYSNRGYKMMTIETDEVIPWIKNRFLYAESGLNNIQ